MSQDYLEVRLHRAGRAPDTLYRRGRPGPNRLTRTIETHTWTVKSKRRRAALNQFNRLAGWRVYVTNARPRRLSLAGAVNCYRQEWHRTWFPSIERGLLAITPLFLKDDRRIRGLLLLLGIALRALTLMEFVVRRSLATPGGNTHGLVCGQSHRATDQPTAERLLKAFEDITL